LVLVVLRCVPVVGEVVLANRCGCVSLLPALMCYKMMCRVGIANGGAIILPVVDALVLGSVQDQVL